MAAAMRTLIKFILVFMLTLPCAAGAAETGLVVKSVRHFSYPTFTRIVFELEAATPYVLTKTSNGKALVFTSYNMPCTVKATLPAIKDGVVGSLELSQDAGRNTIIINLDTAAGEAKDFALRSPDRIVLDITRGSAPIALPQNAAITVVLDPGHGGRDTGVMTPQGPEKVFTLNVALAVKKILQKDTRIKTVLTREKDHMLTLDERAAFTNAARATLLVSIHGATGSNAAVYMYDLVDDFSGQPAQVASRDFLGFEAGSEQQQMLWGKQQAAHARQSGALGRFLAKNLLRKDKPDTLQAPLAGLKAVDAAAVLVEAGMAADSHKIAQAIADGIAQYVRENR
jgi:N-acetylmuramoyl-L-alanine amidase